MSGSDTTAKRSERIMLAALHPQRVDRVPMTAGAIKPASEYPLSRMPVAVASPLCCPNADEIMTSKAERPPKSLVQLNKICNTMSWGRVLTSGSSGAVIAAMVIEMRRRSCGPATSSKRPAGSKKMAWTTRYALSGRVISATVRPMAWRIGESSVDGTMYTAVACSA